jgi:hypothetical protein
MPRMGGRPRRARRVRRRRRRRRILLVGGLVAFGTYKFSQRDAERIEQHTGVDPEELDDAELEQAMNDLDIEPQTVTSADVEDGAAPAGAAPSAGSSAAVAEEIDKLVALRDQGVLTDAEFDAAKQKVLGLD